MAIEWGSLADSLAVKSRQKKIPAARYSPTGNPRSTLAEETLHCRVRNGNGCNLLSMVTGKVLSRRSGKRKKSIVSEYWNRHVFTGP